MRAASDGRIEFGGAFENHISLCLMCRACEQACPSGVRYGTMVETVRVALEKARNPGTIERFVRWLALRQLMPHQGRLRFLAWWIRLYQFSGIQRLVRGLNLLPKALRNDETLLPRIAALRSDYRDFAPAMGERRGQGSVFSRLRTGRVFG